MVKKIALEEHFLDPGLVDYWRPTMVDVAPKKTAELYAALTDFGDRRLQKSPEPAAGRLEEIAAHGQAAVEHVAHHFLTRQDPGERYGTSSHDGEAPFGRVGGRRVGVDGRDLERELDTTDAGQVDGQSEQVRAIGQWGKGPGEGQGKVKRIGRVLVVGETEHRILEGEQGPGVHFQAQVQVERAATGIFGMQLHLPYLAEGVGLDEVPLVVNMEPMVDGVIFEVGHVPGYVDDCHRKLSLSAPWSSVNLPGEVPGQLL